MFFFFRISKSHANIWSKQLCLWELSAYIFNLYYLQTNFFYKGKVELSVKHFNLHDSNKWWVSKTRKNYFVFFSIANCLVTR